ncbi:MAG: hypothetical protein ACLRXQ_12350 [Phascolarctobacterium faecium]
MLWGWQCQIGGILTPQCWSGVPVQTLIFLQLLSLLAIVGGATGMNTGGANGVAKQCAGKYVHPGRVYYSRFYCYPYAVRQRYCSYGDRYPAMLAFTGSMGISTIIPVMIAYIAINAHFILPFHNLAILWRR